MFCETNYLSASSWPTPTAGRPHTIPIYFTASSDTIYCKHCDAYHKQKCDHNKQWNAYCENETKVSRNVIRVRARPIKISRNLIKISVRVIIYWKLTEIKLSGIITYLGGPGNQDFVYCNHWLIYLKLLQQSLKFLI